MQSSNKPHKTRGRQDPAGPTRHGGTQLSDTAGCADSQKPSLRQGKGAVETLLGQRVEPRGGVDSITSKTSRRAGPRSNAAVARERAYQRRRGRWDGEGCAATIAAPTSRSDRSLLAAWAATSALKKHRLRSCRRLVFATARHGGCPYKTCPGILALCGVRLPRQLDNKPDGSRRGEAPRTALARSRNLPLRRTPPCPTCEQHLYSTRQPALPASTHTSPTERTVTAAATATMGEKFSSAFLSDGIDPNNMGPATASATAAPTAGTTLQTQTVPTATATTMPAPQAHFNDRDTGAHIPGWGIAVIVIAILAILAIGWVIHTRVRWGYWGVGLKRVELRGRARCATCGHVTWGGTAACARCQVVRGRAPLEMLQVPERAAVRGRSAAPASDGYYGYTARQEMRREQRAREREAAGVPPAGRDPRKGRFRNYTDTVVERMYVPFI